MSQIKVRNNNVEKLFKKNETNLQNLASLLTKVTIKRNMFIIYRTQPMRKNRL